MPYIEVKLAGKITIEQKKEIVKRITETISDVTGKDKKYCYITINEVKREDWGIGGKLLSGD